MKRKTLKKALKTLNNKDKFSFIKGIRLNKQAKELQDKETEFLKEKNRIKKLLNNK